MRSLLIPGLTILGLVVVGGWVEFQRLSWRNDAGLARAVKVLEGMPESIGDWRGERFERSQSELQKTQAHGAFCTRLKSPGSSAGEVSIMLLCGETRGLSVHQPTTCFQATGWIPLGQPVKRSLQVDGISLELHQIDFSQREHGPPQLRVFWGWSDDARNWQAPDFPRIALNRSPFLYKIYGSSTLTPAEVDREKKEGVPKIDLCQQAVKSTVQELLSRLEKAGEAQSAPSKTTASAH
ncbi:MAG: exosortase-associated EpsI family protein [Planctomycetaceae bacterium]